MCTHAILGGVIVVILMSAPVPVVGIEPAIERCVVGTEVTQVPLSHDPIDVSKFLQVLRQ